MYLLLFSLLLLVTINRVKDMICTSSYLESYSGCTCMCMSLLKLSTIT